MNEFLNSFCVKTYIYFIKATLFLFKMTKIKPTVSEAVRSEDQFKTCQWNRFFIARSKKSLKILFVYIIEKKFSPIPVKFIIK